MNGTYTGVIDRIVDGETVVLLLEADGETVEQRDLDPSEIPESGRQEGAVFRVEIVDDELDTIEYQPDRESERRERAQNRFDRLSKRLGDEK